MKVQGKQGIHSVVVFCLLAFVLFIVVFSLKDAFINNADTENTGKAETELFAMDTYITVTVYGEDTGKAETALSQAADMFMRLERLWSVTDRDSDIYALNQSSDQPVVMSDETVQLISFALQMAEETGGSLEPTLYPVLTAWGFTTETNRVPSAAEISTLLEAVDYTQVRLEGNSVCLADGMMLDLGAVGKGYAGDLVSRVLKENGIESALLDIGGNIQTVGTKPDGSTWRLGLRNPFDGGTLGILEVSNLAVVTSGNYERYFVGEDGKRYGHIIDPATGYPVENGLASVTVISEEGRLCDALSTSLFVMGLEGASDYWRQHKNFEMILVTGNGEIYLTDGAAEIFTLDSHQEDRKVIVIQSE